MEFIKDIIRIRANITKMENTLSDANFMSKAPESVVSLNRKKLADFNNSLDGVMKSVFAELKIRFETDECIESHIQYQREIKYLSDKKITLDECIFDNEYFDFIYNKNISNEEYGELCDKTNFKI